jgi:hypothetical protein
LYYTGLVPYEWLPTAFVVLALRGVQEHEVLQVLYGQQRRPVPMRDLAGVPVLNIWGRTKAGRPLIVTVRPVSGFDSQIVGAPDMTDAEREEFQTWESGR